MISRKLTLAAVLLVCSIAFTFSQTNPFPPKPANAWQIGLNLGVPQIMGDLRSEPFGGNHGPAFGVGLNIRKGMGYVTSLRLHGMYATCYGQEYIQGPFDQNKTLNGVFANNSIDDYSTGADYTSNVWVPNYKTTIGHGSLDLLINLNNINFHQTDPKFLVYAFVGVGGFIYNCKYDALDADGNPYPYNTILDGIGSQNTSQQARLDAIHGVLDGEYETQAEVANPASRNSGEVRSTWVRNPSLSGGIGASWRVGSKMEIGLEERATHFFDDLADGQRWDFNKSYTAHYDLFEYTNLTVGVNLGGGDDGEALWQMNPLTDLYEKVNAISPDELLKDTDNDGVIDHLDKEPNTPEGTPVDTHGVSLDSDKDGCPDSEDPEPFSSPVLPMENCQNVHVTEASMKAYVDQRLKEFNPGGGTGAASDWILPYIFFDTNKYNIRPDAVPALNQIAELMTKYNKINIDVIGHTDVRGDEAMNMKLSENRAKSATNFLTAKGISESRMKIYYKGESEVIIKDAHTEQEHQMNRRVEFKISSNK